MENGEEENMKKHHLKNFVISPSLPPVAPSTQPTRPLSLSSPSPPLPSPSLEPPSLSMEILSDCRIQIFVFDQIPTWESGYE